MNSQTSNPSPSSSANTNSTSFGSSTPTSSRKSLKMNFQRPSDEDIVAQFEILINDSVQSEAARAQMRKMKIDDKWMMLQADKNSEKKKTGNINVKPESFVAKLRENVDPTTTSSLAVMLRTTKLNWVVQFLELGGFKLLFDSFVETELKIT